MEQRGAFDSAPVTYDEARPSYSCFSPIQGIGTISVLDGVYMANIITFEIVIKI